jgi:hypothetical protein
MLAMRLDDEVPHLAGVVRHRDDQGVAGSESARGRPTELEIVEHGDLRVARDERLDQAAIDFAVECDQCL